MKEKVAILTTFMEFQPGYSLTGIVKDQVMMLNRHGHEVHLFVNSGYNGETFPAEVTLHKSIPFSHLVDYKSQYKMSAEHKLLVNTTANALCKELESTGIKIIFTHDFVFTGWNLPYGLACIEVGRRMPDTRWLHWIHSMPSVARDWWNIQTYGKNHKLVFPTASYRTRVAEQYRGMDDNVRIIPHIKDPRTFFDFHEDTLRFIDQNPSVMQADIVQLLPASVDRLEAKRVAEVITIFSELKAMGFSICLVVACQWATGKQQKEDVDRYKQIAKEKGLFVGKEIIFTSEFESPKYDVGIPKHMISQLFLLSNLFIFPTREESFGLVVPEAAASGTLLVLNRSLDNQVEITNHEALYFEFGSFHRNFNPPNEQYWAAIAHTIVARLRQSEVLKVKTFCRQTYNMDSLYFRYYAPVMQEAIQAW